MSTPEIPRYEILEEIARDGLMVICKARCLGRVVALKMPAAGSDAHPATKACLLREGETLARFDHPNVLPIYDVAEFEGIPHLCLKFIEGGTLVGRLTELRQSPRDAARLLATVARAVEYVHQRGILHLDLKPAHVLLDREGEPYLTGFEVARPIVAPPPTDTPAGIFGTPLYMSPEQASAQADLGPAADVWSLGVILYELLTGQPPFQGGTLLETLKLVLESEPAAPRSLDPSINAGLEAICLKCLRKQPRNRCPSAASLADELESWAKAPREEQPRGRGRLRRWLRRPFGR